MNGQLEDQIELQRTNHVLNLTFIIFYFQPPSLQSIGKRDHYFCSEFS